MASGTHISGPIKGPAAVLTLAAGDIVPFHPWPFAGATCTKVDTKTDVDGLLSCGVFQCQIYPNQLRPLWLRGELKKVRSSGAAQSLPKRMISRQPSVASSRLGWWPCRHCGECPHLCSWPWILELFFDTYPSHPQSYKVLCVSNVQESQYIFLIIVIFTTIITVLLLLLCVISKASTSALWFTSSSAYSWSRWVWAF